MAGPLDSQLGAKVESTYGTAVTVDRFVEWDQEGSDHKYDPKVVQGTGMQVGDGGVPRADRSVSVIGQSSGSISMDVTTKGQGIFWKAALGVGTSTLVSGTVYQQLFTTSMTTGLLDALTLQYGIVESVAAGTVDPITYPGCTITDLELACEAGGILKAKLGWDGLAPTTATGLATASYTVSTTPYHFGMAAVTMGGSVTVPTTTALATGGTAVTNVRNMTLTLPNNANLERWRFGGRNQPRVAVRDGITIKATVEYDALTMVTALLSHTTVPVTWTFTHTETQSTGFSQFQVCAPACKLVAAPLPSPSADPVLELEFKVLKPAAGAALYIAQRTSDTAL